jgi:hypothetical protein
MRSVFTSSLALATSLAATLSLAGCFIAVEDDDHFEPGPVARGDLSIAWTFDGFGWCGEVEDVRLTLIDPEGFIYDDTRYGCGVESILYEQVDEGWWTIDLEGIDRYGRIIYAGSAELWVAGNAYNEYDIDLRTY